ncbi:double-stranded RNA-binding protein 2 [Canna indica]|uniref:Double-stranded RNA-binding protein 2 n=1 Tax=Canna indica TaxID=4628 RepID=A0AAQ3QKA4_9LILI|nr:double-stranded RNA-binding protein 2 [Canna indica]
MYKNQLQELAQRSCFNLPSYACIREGPDHAPRFKATVNFNGEFFESPAFYSTLRQAEHAAAEVALNTLSKRGPSRALAAKVLDETGIYKNLLQETAHRAGLKLPVYTTVRSGPGHTPTFTCTVELAGMSFKGDPSKTKKQAQKNAAMTAWSKLKNLSYVGTSSPSSSLLTESEWTGEQEQVMVARALANLHLSEENKASSRNGQQRECKRPAPLAIDMLSTSSVCFYPMPLQSWVYPEISSEAAMYQMWHQAQAEQQARLSLAPCDHNRNCRILPTPQPVYQPSQVQLFPSIEQHRISSSPCVTISSLDLPKHFSDYSASVPLRSQSQPKIQEIHEEQDQRGGKEWRIRLSDAAACSAFDVSDSSIPLDDGNNVSTVQKPLEPSVEGAHLEEEDSNCVHGFSSDTSTSRPSIVQDSADFTKVQETKPAGRRQRKASGRMHHSSLARAYNQNVNSLNPTQVSHGTHHTLSKPSSVDKEFRPAAISTSLSIRSPTSLCSSGFRVEALRPRLQQSAGPVSSKPGIPIFLSRSSAVDRNGQFSRPSFIAPPVNVRAVIPVCSAPPVKQPEINQKSTNEKETT